MLIMFSRGFKDIRIKTAKVKEFPGHENKFQNSRGFKEIKDTWEPCFSEAPIAAASRIIRAQFFNAISCPESVVATS